MRGALKPRASQCRQALGKVNAPYKEVIVEEAIARLLEVAVDNRSELVEALLERQSQRNLE